MENEIKDLTLQIILSTPVFYNCAYFVSGRKTNHKQLNNKVFFASVRAPSEFGKKKAFRFLTKSNQTETSAN